MSGSQPFTAQTATAARTIACCSTSSRPSTGNSVRISARRRWFQRAACGDVGSLAMQGDYSLRGAKGFCQSHLSVIVPAYNEEEVLLEFHRRLSDVMNSLSKTWEVIYVNDGSGDSTLALLEGLVKADPHVGFIDLSRNFGKEIAMTAGLDHALGDAAIVIDADFEEPPWRLRGFLRGWQQAGGDGVFWEGRSRAGGTG